MKTLLGLVVTRRSDAIDNIIIVYAMLAAFQILIVVLIIQLKKWSKQLFIFNSLVIIVVYKEYYREIYENTGFTQDKYLLGFIHGMILLFVSKCFVLWRNKYLYMCVIVLYVLSRDGFQSITLDYLNLCFLLVFFPIVYYLEDRIKKFNFYNSIIEKSQLINLQQILTKSIPISVFIIQKPIEDRSQSRLNKSQLLQASDLFCSIKYANDQCYEMFQLDDLADLIPRMKQLIITPNSNLDSTDLNFEMDDRAEETLFELVRAQLD